MTLSDLVGRGWVVVGPPLDRDGNSTVARWNGTPINVGFLMEQVEDSEDLVHYKYRSGQFDVEVKIDFDIGRGQARVQRAEGYQ